MTSESDMRAADGFAGDGFAGDGFAGDGFAGDGFAGDGFAGDGCDLAFFGVAAFDADAFSAAGFTAFAADCAAPFFRGFLVVFFLGMWFSQTTGFMRCTRYLLCTSEVMTQGHPDRSQRQG
jgi:hypothetical protein